MNGTVNPNGADTTYHFEYDTVEYKEGEEESHGTNVPGEEVGSGVKDVEVSEPIAGLKADTTYHFRVVATNDEGTSYGEDRTFTTLGSTVLCSSAKTYCEEGNVYASGTEIEAQLQPETSLVLKDTEGKTLVSCSSSTLGGKTTAEQGDPLSLELSSLTLSGCTGGSYECASSGEARNLPYAGGLARTEAGDGALSLEEGGEGKPGFRFTSCTVFNVECVWGAGELGLALEGGNPAGLVAEEVPLERDVGNIICAAAVKLSASWEVSGPKPAFATTAPTFTVLCAEGSANPCPSESTYASGTEIEAQLQPETSLVLKNTEGKTLVSCSSSTLGGKTTAKHGSPLPVEVSALTLSGCTGGSYECASSGEARNLPYAGGLARTEAGDGALTLEEGGKGKPGFRFESCAPPFNVECVWGAGELGLALEGGNPAGLVAEEVPLERDEGNIICAAAVKLSASWEVSGPKPAFATGGV